MKRFIQDVKSAVYDTNFVEKFRSRSRKQAVLSVVKLVVTGIILISAVYLGILVPGLVSILHEDRVAEYYPHGLEVNIVNGIVSTNQAEPYYMRDTVTPEREREHENFLVIDTGVTDPLKQFASYDTYVLLTKDSIIARENGAEIRVMSLEKTKEAHVTEANVTTWVREALPTVWGLGAAFALLTVVGTIALALSYYLLIAFPLAWLVRFASGKNGWNFTYRESYVLTAYLLTLPIIVSIVSGFFFMSVSVLMTVFIFLLAYIVNVKAKPQVPAEPTQAA